MSLFPFLHMEYIFIIWNSQTDSGLRFQVKIRTTCSFQHSTQSQIDSFQLIHNQHEKAKQFRLLKGVNYMQQSYNPDTTQPNQTNLAPSQTHKTKPDHGQLFTVGTPSILVSPVYFFYFSFVNSENTDEEPLIIYFGTISMLMKPLDNPSRS